MPYGMRDVKDGSQRSMCVGQTALDKLCAVCLVLRRDDGGGCMAIPEG